MELSNESVLLMDGGFPMDLVDRADALPLWIDDYNASNPDVVIENHLSYLQGKYSNMAKHSKYMIFEFNIQ